MDPESDAQVLIERAKAKGLMSQAEVLAARPDPASQLQAKMLWEEALNSRRLFAFDELKCHYALGSYFLAQGDLGQGLPHVEYILAKDPDLDFLCDVDDATKKILKAELFVTSSVAFQSVAKEMAKGRPGPTGAAAFLQERIDLLRNRAAPCVFLEMSELKRHLGDNSGADQALCWAIDAPTYNTESQITAVKTAKKLLSEMPAPPSITKDARSSGEPALDLTSVLGRKPRKWRKRLMWAAPALLIISVFGFLVVPTPYRKHFKQAKALYSRGRYADAMVQVGQARAEKSTAALSALESQIQVKLDEIRERERQATLQREYDSYYGQALSAFNNRRYENARELALLAKERKSTGQVDSLLSRTERVLRRQEAVEKARVEREALSQQAEADDASYRHALGSGTEEALKDYLRAFPNGRHALTATNRIAVLQRWAEQEQKPSTDQTAVVSKGPDPIPVVQFQRPTTATLKIYLEDALRRLEERTSASTPTRPNSPTVDISRAREREKRAWMEQTLRSIDAALGALKTALSVAEQIPDQRANNSITSWIALTQKARDQLVSKKVLSDINSFNNQKQVIKGIRDYLYR
jgi:hypothetical protein